MIELTSADGHVLDAYESHPEGATVGLVVIQEIFGVNAHIRDVAESYAAEGYHVIAPALFDRVERGVELGYTADGVAAGRTIRQSLEWEDATADVGAAVEHVARTGPVGVVGYCFGGSMAWLAAALPNVEAAVGYYGGQIVQFVNSAPSAPVLLHFGALDKSIPISDVDAIRDAYPGIGVHVYADADHGFSCDARASYNAEAAKLARQRTLEFFSANLVG